MGRARVQEVACLDAAWITSRIRRTSVAIERIVDSIPLRVVEDVESLGTEFKLYVLRNGKVL